LKSLISNEDLIYRGLFSGSGGADSRKKGSNRARFAECFSEDAIPGKTILDFCAVGANSCGGLRRSRRIKQNEGGETI
jgi:hypothetical protein